MTPRTLLIVTPSNESALALAAASRADALIVDVADADAAALKRTAALLAGAPTVAVWLRLGPAAALATTTTLDALMRWKPAGIVLARAEGGADVTRLSALLRPREAMAGIADGATRIIAMATDTPAGLLALATYRGASRRLMALAWDDAPLARALGADDTTDVERLARTGTLLAAAAAGVAALDRPCRGSDADALRTEAAAAHRAGFHGKLAIASDQVAIINAVFSRSAATSR